MKGKHKLRQFLIDHNKPNSVGKELKGELDKDRIFRTLSILSNVLIVFNSSINFLIYLFKDPK